LVRRRHVEAAADIPACLAEHPMILEPRVVRIAPEG
jgi:hypothetical protein